MKGFYIPDYKCAIITANKSGSRGILNTLIMFFDYVGIKYEYLVGSGYTAIPNVKYYLLVRNPIERFFTTYSWLIRDNLQISREDDDIIVKDVLKKYNITTIEDYANNYKKLYQDLQFDTHFFEQFYSFIPPSNHKNNGIDITYDELYQKFNSVFDDYEFIHVETISTICNDYQNNFNLVDNGTTNESNEFMIDVFSEFCNLPIEQKKLSNIFYNYIIQILDSRHHNKIKTKEIRQNYIDTLLRNHIQMFKSELMLYGYVDTPKLL